MTYLLNNIFLTYSYNSGDKDRKYLLAAENSLLRGFAGVIPAMTPCLLLNCSHIKAFPLLFIHGYGLPLLKKARKDKLPDYGNA